MNFWVTLIVFLAVQSITPGPNNITCLYLGGNYGFKGTYKFLTASMISLFIKALLCGLLNIALSEIIPSIMVYFKWIGAAYFVYLAIVMILSGWKKEEENDVNTKYTSSYGSGVLLQVMNAKSWVACLSMFAVYVIPYRNDFWIILIASLIFMILCLISSIIWAMFGQLLKSFIEKYKKVFGIVMGALLLYCAITALL